MTTTMKHLMLSAAMAGLITGVSAQASASVNTSARHSLQSAASFDDDTMGKKEKHSCKGQNSCKGKGGCKSSDNGCKGKNSCKGKGGCATDGSKPPA